MAKKKYTLGLDNARKISTLSMSDQKRCRNNFGFVRLQIKKGGLRTRRESRVSPEAEVKVRLVFLFLARILGVVLTPGERLRFGALMPEGVVYVHVYAR